MVIVDLLAPLFLLIVLGAVLHRVGLLPAEVIGPLNRLLYWVGLPVVVFHSLAVAEPVAGQVGPLLGLLLLATAVSIGLAWGWSLLLRVPPRGRGTFVQAAFRGNLSYIGLPLLLSVPGLPRAAAVLSMAPMLIVYNAVSVAWLLASRGDRQSGGRVVLREIARNPIILASLAGAAWHYLGWPLSTPVQRTLRTIAEMSLPLALLMIGAALLMFPLRGNLRAATVASLHKVALSPLAGYVIGRWWGLDGGTLLAALLCLACPTAAVSYTMSRQFEGDEALAAAAVVLSALLAMPALALILAVFTV